MSPIESAQLSQVVEEVHACAALRGEMAEVARGVRALRAAAAAQAMFGARPWVAMVVALLALGISTLALVRGETRAQASAPTSAAAERPCGTVGVYP